MLLGPFASKLPQRGTIVIDAEGELASIPWAALEDQPGHALIERFSFCQALGLVEALAQKHDRKFERNEALILGSPELEGELSAQYPSLPDATREAENVYHRFPHAVLLQGKQATADAFSRHVQESTLFHFAGHGISYGGFGALLLAPANKNNLSTQYITAGDIAGLDLRRMQLVVLAACSSGVGEHSGIVNLDSLTRAFLQAGAYRVIASNWDVDSAYTVDLMSAFYDHLAVGEKPAEALRQAELRIRRISPHPHLWGAFRLFGTP